MAFNENDFIGKVISEFEVSGYGVRIVTKDGLTLDFNASDGGYSSWDIRLWGKR